MKIRVVSRKITVLIFAVMLLNSYIQSMGYAHFVSGLDPHFHDRSTSTTLLDRAALDSLDPETLAAQLASLRSKNDGSVKYQRAIALLESFLAGLRPKEMLLLANYPNPFNPETWIPYHLAHASDVQITIYDMYGTAVRRLNLGHQREGYYTNRSSAAYWDGRNEIGERVASGVYFYQLGAEKVSPLRKMVILK